MTDLHKMFSCLDERTHDKVQRMEKKQLEISRATETISELEQDIIDARTASEEAKSRLNMLCAEKLKEEKNRDTLIEQFEKEFNTKPQ
jgi:hypothetical protein